MCGVVGFSAGKGTTEPTMREAFIRLCRESRIRGVHAFGIAFWNGKVNVFRSTDFDQVMNQVPNPLPSRIIFHNRYCTSGDYKIPENNQPLLIDNCAMAFNGTIDMGTRSEMEARSGYKMQTENDGELVLRDFLAGYVMKRLKENLATFAGVFLTKDGKMYALRNEMRPLNAISFYGCTLICSTRDIALRAKFEKNSVHQIEPFKLTEI